MVVRGTGHKTPGESSEIRMRLLEGSSTLYISLSVRVGRIGAKLVSQTSFGHISINSPSILTVSMATESP